MIMERELSILAKRTSQTFYKPKDVHCDKCCGLEYFFNKHVDYCESVGHNHSLLPMKFTASVKKSSHQVCGSCFYTCLTSPLIDKSSIWGFLEWLLTNELCTIVCAHTSLWFASGSTSLQLTNKFDKYDTCAKDWGY